MMKQFLTNPFIRLAGGKALFAGLLFLLITGLVASFVPAHFDGVLDTHSGKPMPYWVFLAEQLINWIVLTICMYIPGLLFASSRPRLIDMAGTMAFARWPLLFTALLFMLPVPQPDIHDLGAISPFFWIVVLLNIIVLVWVIALMYKAFTTSAHIKGQKAVLSFIIALIIAEVISKIMIFQIYKHLIPQLKK